MVLFEEVIKEYTRYLLCSQTNVRLEAMDEEHAKAPPYCSLVQTARLAPGAWDWVTWDFIEKAYKEVESTRIDEADDLRQLCRLNMIYFSCATFEHWKPLIVGKAIRNLEVHNDGRMNERNFRIAKLCKVGDRPVWNHGLIYDVFYSLACLNGHLNRLRIEPT